MFGKLAFLHNWMFIALALKTSQRINVTLQLPNLNVAAKTQLLPLYKSAHIPAMLPFVAVLHNSSFKLTLAGCQTNQVVQKILLMFRMRPAAITLN